MGDSHQRGVVLFPAVRGSSASAPSPIGDDPISGALKRRESPQASKGFTRSFTRVSDQ
jgi:hypothetical protein